MTREDLIDEVYEALSNAQDMDTTLTDYAKAAADCLAARLDAQVKSALDAMTAALHAKYPDAYLSVSVSVRYRSLWTCYFYGLPNDMKPDGARAETLADLQAGVLAAIADLPPRWSDEQIAATLGIGVAA